MKQSDLDSMSIDELCMLHERITPTLAAKIAAEKEMLIDQLKQAEMSVHERVCDLRGGDNRRKTVVGTKL
jgi:hypothetical protein